MQAGCRARKHTSMSKVEPQSELKGLITSATEALAQLDAEALEALTLACKEMASCSAAAREERASGWNGSSLATFARVIEASRANLRVLRQLSAMRTTRLDYGLAITSAVRPERGSGQH